LAPFTLAFIQRRGLRAAGIASGRVSTQARIAPLDVPATRWKRPAIGRRLRRSISASTNAGINPHPATVDRQHPRRSAAY
jgi:hypothetical protein